MAANKNANAKTLSIQDVAEIVNVPAKTIRKVLRNSIARESQPGRGGRWVIAESQLPIIQKMIESHTRKTHSVIDLAEFDSDADSE